MIILRITIRTVLISKVPLLTIKILVTIITVKVKSITLITTKTLFSHEKLLHEALRGFCNYPPNL